MTRLLVVDDDDFTRGFLRDTLARAGYETVEAADGREAVARFREGGVDLVVIDLFMPGLNGVDALLQLDLDRHPVPVIVLSGGSFSTLAEPHLLAEALGAVRFLPKPIRREALLTVVRDLLESAPEGDAPGPPGSEGPR